MRNIMFGLLLSLCSLQANAQNFSSTSCDCIAGTEQYYAAQVQGMLCIWRDLCIGIEACQWRGIFPENDPSLVGVNFKGRWEPQEMECTTVSTESSEGQVFYRWFASIMEDLRGEPEAKQAFLREVLKYFIRRNRF